MDVRDHGALGNGVADDSVAIAAAIAAAPTPGSVVFFPPGEYRLSASVRPRASQVLLGVPGASTLKPLDGITGFTVVVADVSDGVPVGSSAPPVSLRGLTIDGNRSNTTRPTVTAPWVSFEGSGVRLRTIGRHSTGHRVVECQILNCHDWGLVVQVPATADTSRLDVIVDSCRIEGNGGGGVWLANLRGGSRVTDTGLRANTLSGVQVQRCHDVSLAAITAEDNGAHGVVVVYSRDFRVHDSHTRRNAEWGICAGGGSPDPNFPPNARFSIVGNHSPGNGSGGISIDLRIEGSYEPRAAWATVTGNVCAGDGTGINGINVNGSKYVTISGNSIQGMPHNGIGVTNASSVVIAHNLLTDNTVGINIASAPEAGTIQFENVTVTENMYDNNTQDRTVYDAHYTGVVIKEA